MFKNEQRQKAKSRSFQRFKKIKNNVYSSQRELANELGFSLGKLNYCF